MLAVPLRRHLFRHLFVEQLGKRVFGAALLDHSAFGNGVTHRGEEPLNEQALELQRGCPQARGIVRLRRSTGQLVQRPTGNVHRTMISAAMAPMARSDSKIAAISAGGAWTACNAAAMRVTGVPLAILKLFGGAAVVSLAPIVIVTPPWLTVASPTTRSPPAMIVPSR